MVDVRVVPPDLEKVCPVLVENLAANYHRGKWLAWKDAQGMTPTKDEVHLDKGRSVFWLFENGKEGAANVTCSYYTKAGVYNKDGTLRRFYYIDTLSGTTLDGDDFFANFLLRNGTLEEDMGKVVNYDEELNNNSHVICIEPECHRLMLAQNLRVVPFDESNPGEKYGVFDDKADVQWFVPRIHHVKSANFLTTNPRVCTDARPYIIPESSYGGGSFDEKPYGVEWACKVHNSQETRNNFRTDWRYNPKWIVQCFDDHLINVGYDDSDSNQLHPILKITPQAGTNVEIREVYKYDDTGAIIGTNPEPRRQGGTDLIGSAGMIEFACGLGGTRKGFGPIPLSEVKYHIENNGAYHYENPNHESGWTGEWTEWDQWDSLNDLIMLYGMKTTKHYSRFDKQIPEEKKDEQGNTTTEIRHVPVWVYDHTEWEPIYWEPLGNARPVDPPVPFGELLRKKLSGEVEAYKRDQEMEAHGWRDHILHGMEDMNDLIGGETVFDLRLYCVRYNWKALPLVPDRKYNEQTGKWENQYEEYKKKDELGRLVDVNGFKMDEDGNVFDQEGRPTSFAFGEQAYIKRLKVKVSRDPRDIKRGYFNTLCRADVRRVVKASAM